MKHPLKPLDILRDPPIRVALVEAWKESRPGLTGGHEEGGFIVLGEGDRLNMRRWPTGEGNLIRVPSRVGCTVDGLPIVATFHTHPNTGPDFLQEPGETDKRGVKEDADLKGGLYVGEIVVTNEMIYLITPGGTVREMDTRLELLG
ncbi:MAG: hypothetical protein AAB380_01070 [Verrucomicrobiota bacterium]